MDSIPTNVAELSKYVVIRADNPLKYLIIMINRIVVQN